MTEFLKVTSYTVGITSFLYLVVSYWYFNKFGGFNSKALLIALYSLFLITPIFFITSAYYKFVLRS